MSDETMKARPGDVGSEHVELKPEHVELDHVERYDLGVSDQDMPAEVDFSHGRRGQFAKRMRRDVVYVPLAPDVSEAFKTADEVNSALRLLIKTAAAAMPPSEQKAGKRER